MDLNKEKDSAESSSDIDSEEQKKIEADSNKKPALRNQGGNKKYFKGYTFDDKPIIPEVQERHLGALSGMIT